MNHDYVNKKISKQRYHTNQEIILHTYLRAFKRSCAFPSKCFTILRIFAYSIAIPEIKKLKSLEHVK